MHKLTFEDALKIAIDQTIEGIQILNKNWEYVYINTAAANHGRSAKENLIGRKITDCYPGIESTPIFKEIKTVMETQTSRRTENLFNYPDGTKCWFELYIEPHSEGILIRSMDITERKKIEEQYFQAKKLEAIGEIAGGVAHDFNNKLGIILAYGEMLSSKLENQNINLKSYSEKIIKAVHQASKLTKQLLAFSRKQVLDFKVVNLNELIEDVSGNLSKILGEDVTLKTKLALDLASVRTDPFQMEQLIFNLCTNAREAMPKGGVLHIETANVYLDKEYVKSHSDVLEGDYVMLAVSDSGHGMDRKTLDRVFEPFFTTKERGKGTGLGLAMVHGFVRQSQGYVWSYSELGQGTVFKVYLPKATNSSETTDVIDGPSLQAVSQQLNGTETILLAEDEAHLREACKATLENAGYKVIVAKDAQEALQLFELHQGKIDLLLTDVIMPAVTGPELARQLIEKKSDLKVIYMSGYTSNFIAHQGILDEKEVLLQKPIFTHNLLKSVRGVLDNKIVKAVV